MGGNGPHISVRRVSEGKSGQPFRSSADLQFQLSQIMKRTPLRRLTPLKKSAKPLKKTKLKKMSKDKAGRMEQYRKQHESDPAMVVDAQDGRKRPKSRMQRHHVARRLGNRLLIYCYIQPGFHDWAETHVQQALKEGWIRKEGEGYAKDPNQPRPWYPGSCINEHLLESFEK